MVLTRGDDFPIHQTPETIVNAGTDRNFYDRYFFNGCSPDGSTFFAVAFGVYPQLDVADAHFCVLRDGMQFNLHASCEMNMERMAMKVGPISIEVIEPLNILRVVVEEAEGISADLTFTGRAFPIEEPRFTHRVGTRVFMDYTRLTQNGHYSGWISVDGDRQDLRAGSLGTRDRSWGIRPIGARDPQPIPGAPPTTFFWHWTPVNLPDGSLFFHINAEPDGKAWNTRAAWAADGAGIDGIREGEGSFEVALEPGTRWPTEGTLHVDIEGAPSEVLFKPLARFQMRGLGYTSPVWGHGMHHGALKIEREDIDPAAVDPLKLENLHVQMVCDVTTDSGARGLGVLEQLIIGPYAPLGLTGYEDGA